MRDRTRERRTVCPRQRSARRRPAVVVVHDQPGVLELIEATLRDLDAHVLVTGNSLEALEVVRRLKIDLLVTGPALGLTRDARLLQPDLSVVVLDDEPMSLDDIADAAIAALAARA
jgi:CheY-like chemotaxis protein